MDNSSSCIRYIDGSYGRMEVDMAKFLECDKFALID